MSCHGCGTKYGLFTKEYGCKQCGFSFCGKCCNNKIVVPRIDATKKQVVCNACYEALKNGKSKANAESNSPPLAYKKRIAASTSKTTQLENKGEFQDPKDQEIANKLKRLKHQGSLGPAATQTEIEERLAVLKGIDPKKYTAPPIMVYREKDSRTAIEQTQDLIKQYQKEVELDSQHPCSVEDIEARLARLKDNETDKNKQTTSKQENTTESIDPAEILEKLGLEKDNLEDKAVLEEAKKLLKEKKDQDKSQKERTESSDEEELVKKIVKQYSEEASLDEKPKVKRLSKQPTIEFDSSDDEENEEDSDELPWCVICMKNAQLRCYGCDRDLYCMRCFKECHDSFEITDHATTPYKIPKHKKDKDLE